LPTITKQSQLSLGEADRSACPQRPANVNVVSYLFTKLPIAYLTVELPLSPQVLDSGQTAAATWLLLAAYTNLLTPYPTVPSLTPYDVLFSHNT